MTDLPALPGQAASAYTRDLVKLIAMDIGKAVCAYIEVQYPKAVQATSSTFLLSVRNSIHNEIMGALEHTSEAEILAWLEDRKRFRRKWKAVYRKIRDKAPVLGDAVEDV